MKFIVGTKERMTQIFDADGVCHPATVLRVESAAITRIKTKDSDGYDAVQVATGVKKDHRVRRADKGQHETAETVREWRPKSIYGEDITGLTVGQTLNAETFAAGDKIAVSAVSKGKGFQGVVKRHNFAGGPRTHGQKHSERRSGSIGSTGNMRVLKGTRMAGRMGGDRITVKNLTVLQVDAANNLLLVKGAVPGRKGTLVEVRGAN